MGENILARVGGEWVGAAANTLPPAATATETRMQTVIEVPRFGRVRFTFERTRYRHNKHVGSFWSGKHAEVIDA